MAIPLAPIAAVALRYGAVAALAFVIGSKAKPVPKDAIREKAHDDAAPGFSAYARKEPGEVSGHASARFHKVASRFGFELDGSVLARLRFRKSSQGARN